MKKDIQKDLQLTQGYENLRRYFVMNAFDGVLTVIGILIGTYITDSINPSVVIKITLATGLTMFVSGTFGTFVTEKAERKKSLRDMEKALLADLQTSIFKKANKTTTLILSIVDGLSSLMASILVISPFFFTLLISSTTAFYISIGLALTCLFSLGIFLGKISEEKIFLSGFKMLIIGTIAILLTSLLGLI